MKIKKTDGTLQIFTPNKILVRIKNQAKGLKVNPDVVFQKVIPSISDGMTTIQIDEIIAYKCSDLIKIHPDYSILASRIIITRHAKILGVKPEQVDLDYDFFATVTFLEKYSLKDVNKNPIELPSMMYDRVAKYLANNTDEFELYSSELKSKKISVATPILTNTNPKRGSLISCNLTHLIDDSLEGIQQTLFNLARASKEGAGIGLLIDSIRSKKTNVSTFDGNASGLIRLADMVQGTMRFYKQGSRSGSCSLYLSLWHRDIIDFLELKLPNGNETTRMRDLFLAVVVNDLFMNKLKSNESWYIFCPHDIKKAGLRPLHDLWGDEFELEYEKAVQLGLGEEVDPKTIWDAIIRSQAESGVPYVWYKDAANRKNMQSNIGVVKQSNLCVSPETLILTKDGYKVISTLENKNIEVWNGKQWSSTKVVKTGENQKLLKVTLSNGSVLNATEYHKWYIQRGYIRGTGKNKLSIIEKRTSELEANDKIIKFKTPLIDFNNELVDAYTQGFFTGDGCHYNDKNHIDLYHTKLNLVNHLNCVTYGVYDEINKRQRVKVSDDYIKYFIPMEYSIKSRVEWLCGLFDADACVTTNNKTQSIQFTSIHVDFIRNVGLLLQTLGIQSKISKTLDKGFRLLPDHKGNDKEYYCNEVYRLLIGQSGINRLKSLGFMPKRLILNDNIPNRNAEQFIKVISIEDENRYDDTYCVNELLEHKVIFNGVLTGNCIEIVEVSKPNYTPQCTLGLIPLPFHDTLDSIGRSTRVLVRMLNSVIDKNKWSDEASKIAGEDQRALAIGIGGLADFFAKKELSFTSDEAKRWNKDIVETIYKSALDESRLMSIERNETYPAWIDSPYYHGKTVIDGWNPNGDVNKPIPLLNSLFVALMPSASTSILLAVNECFEPFSSNMYTRKTGAGEFNVVNKWLVKDLEDLHIWDEQMSDLIIYYEGSIQDINIIPQYLKERYRTIWEIPQRELINMAADRQEYIDQSQSMNIYFNDVTYTKISSALMYAWEKKLKTGCYYMRTEKKTSKPKRLYGMNLPQKPANSRFMGDCLGCSA